ncbi:MAG: hypothetical protein ACHQF0_08685 [Chitinophagales bacterium]
MKNKNIWVDLSILNLCIVAFFGFILRSKILFSLPWINYLYLLDAHFHFAFGGWMTLALLSLFVQELLTEPFDKKPIYQWMLGGIVLSSWGSLLTPFLGNNSFLGDFFSLLFIAVTYSFGFMILRDSYAIRINKTVRLLSTSAIVSLILSSAGPITLIWLQAIKSTNATLYRDASYVYLHFQYNGFFTLAVFSLLFLKLYPKISKKSQLNFYRFSVLLCFSIFPSLFLSFLWQEPSSFFRLIAITGSILVFASIVWFIVAAFPVLKFSKLVVPLGRNILFLSIGAFVLKMFLQSLTIFSSVGNAVFGDRPVIIGFLHLVFLGFVSPFILVYFMHKNFLNSKIKVTEYALIFFVSGIVCNETTLMLQGLGAIFLKSSYLFSWLLWGISFLLMTGAILIFIARMKSSTSLQNLP